jgi:hypothetical protein
MRCCNLRPRCHRLPTGRKYYRVVWRRLRSGLHLPIAMLGVDCDPQEAEDDQDFVLHHPRSTDRARLLRPHRQDRRRLHTYVINTFELVHSSKCLHLIIIINSHMCIYPSPIHCTESVPQTLVKC